MAHRRSVAMAKTLENFLLKELLAVEPLRLLNRYAFQRCKSKNYLSE